MAAKFPAPPDRLFDMYLDPSLQAAFTGAPVRIGVRPGSEFRAFNGGPSGRIFSSVPKRLIGQSWRAPHWSREDLESTLILTFWREADGARIDWAHVKIAEPDFDDGGQGRGIVPDALAEIPGGTPSSNRVKRDSCVISIRLNGSR